MIILYLQKEIMPVKDNEKNKAYVAKHGTNKRETLGDEEYKRREAEARALRRKKEKERKAQQAFTLLPLKPLVKNELFDVAKLQPLDINNLINLLPPLPKPQEKKKRGRKPNLKPQEEITDNMTYKEKRRIYEKLYEKLQGNKLIIFIKGLKISLSYNRMSRISSRANKGQYTSVKYGDEPDIQPAPKKSAKQAPKPAPKPARQPRQPAPAPAASAANVALPARVVDNPKSQNIQEKVNMFMAEEIPYWKGNFYLPDDHITTNILQLLNIMKNYQHLFN
jgi:hypothetical protein